jgi:hypothetical protein
MTRPFEALRLVSDTVIGRLYDQFGDTSVKGNPQLFDDARKSAA